MAFVLVQSYSRYFAKPHKQVAAFTHALSEK